ncbi:hypothetical protein FISHEDRAFT_59067 [Fistulina hepatica ATCC 64428]|uniref:Transcription factor CBF/NF-Y/archaeal histone domain-containing protein n=1 Tax=Fistulina hepatica ATCC 64428 TaxID=1128425 RepID=A0A0D7AEF5_9AGAR|nr:hypothetical protein FISHEDRAFT_59067 [Fistulina hepatica ATCC 64428]
MASHFATLGRQSSEDTVHDVDVDVTYASDAEDDVDQLYSSDGETDPTSKKGQRDVGRVPGTSDLSNARLQNIIQSEGVTGDLVLSREALFVLSVATEEFITRLAHGGLNEAQAEHRNVVQYTDMANRHYRTVIFAALQNLNRTSSDGPMCAPKLQPYNNIKNSSSSELREQREREMMEEDPAIPPRPDRVAPSALAPPHPGIHNSSSSTSKKRNGTTRKEGRKSGTSSRASTISDMRGDSLAAVMMGHAKMSDTRTESMPDLPGASEALPPLPHHRERSAWQDVVLQPSSPYRGAAANGDANGHVASSPPPNADRTPPCEPPNAFSSPHSRSLPPPQTFVSPAHHHVARMSPQPRQNSYPGPEEHD